MNLILLKVQQAGLGFFGWLIFFTISSFIFSMFSGKKNNKDDNENKNNK